MCYDSQRFILNYRETVRASHSLRSITPFATLRGPQFGQIALWAGAHSSRDRRYALRPTDRMIAAMPAGCVLGIHPF